MHSVKIPGSRYVLTLENKLGEWTLKIKLDNNVEAETSIPTMSKRALLSKITELLKEMKIQIPDIQINLMHKDLVNQAGDVLRDDSDAKGGDDGLASVNNKIENILKSLTKLEQMMDSLESRVDRLERLSTS